MHVMNVNHMRPSQAAVSVSCIALVLLASPMAAVQAENDGSGTLVCAPLGEFKTLPDDPVLVLHDITVDRYTRAPQARVDFKVDGTGLAAVVVDSGINFFHRGLATQVIRGADGAVVGKDLTSTAGTDDELLDTYGHGSGVAGLISGVPVIESGLGKGIAPGARIIPVKVYRGGADNQIPVDRVSEALEWVLANHQQILQDHRIQIGVVNLSLGFSQNALQIGDLNRAEYNRAKDVIQSLREEGIAVVVASGNRFHDYEFEQGMDFPAICDPAISVGAVYDVSREFDEKQFYAGECWVKRAEVNRIAPFSQRLAAAMHRAQSTTIFAPGHNVSSVCRWDETQPDSSRTGASANDGTSRAAPIVAGAVLLIQEYYQKRQQRLPTVTKVERALCEGGEEFVDDEESPPGAFDSVTSTGHSFRRLDVLEAVKRISQIVYDEQGATNLAAEAGSGDTSLSMPVIQ